MYVTFRKKGLWVQLLKEFDAKKFYLRPGLLGLTDQLWILETNKNVLNGELKI